MSTPIEPQTERARTREHEAPSTPYLPTILSGLVVLTVAVLVALAQLTDITIDLGLVLPVGMVATGALLVLGAVLAAVRAGRRGDG